MTSKDRAREGASRDQALGTIKQGGETPERRFAGHRVTPGEEQKGDIERAPFEGHPDSGSNPGRPDSSHAVGADAAGRHGQRPANPGK